MTPEVILFSSPKAGSGAARDQIPRVIDLLGAAGISHLHCTCPKQLARTVASARETGVSRPVVIAAGGDGTLGLAAEKTDAETVLLPMPLGTENLLARHYGQSSRAEEVLRTLQDGNDIRIDAGDANGKLFLIVASAGFDAEVVRALHLRRTGHIRRASYLKPVMRTLKRYRFPELKVTEFDEEGRVCEQRDVGWAMVFNLPCYGGGLKIQRETVSDDGLLDVITFAGRGVISALRYLSGVVTGTHVRQRDVVQDRVGHVRIECDQRVAYELDGDYVGRLPLEIRTLPKRIRLRVPREA